jgi:hypothetical protein
MSIIAKQENESSFSPIPEGVHTAQCYAIVDLGVHYSEKFDKKSRKVQIMWELPEEKYEHEGQELPRVISKEYTLSLGEKANLRKDLQAWRGKAFTEEELQGFDLKNVLGKGCQLQIIHTEKNGKTYGNIASIMGLPKGMKLAEPINDAVYFDLESPEAIQDMDILPTWVQDKIKDSETYAALKESQPDFTPAPEEDGLPF